MRKFLIKTAVLAVLLCAVDAAVGAGCRFLQGRAKGGDTGRLNYIADEMEDEILVFGSSRALRHYDPRILADSLGLTCCNCGEIGNGIIHCYGKYRLFRDRYVPRVIVYDLYHVYDLSEGDNERFLPWLRCYYGREGIDSIVRDVDAAEKWKMLSMMRRYNEKFVKLAVDAFHPVVEFDGGFRPREQAMVYEPGKGRTSVPSDLRVDTLKMKYWRKLVADCKARGTRLVFAVSPFYAPPDTMPEYVFIRELARREGIPFLSHAGDTAFTGKRCYFYDGYHLNREGAEAFTRVIASELRELLKEEN